MKTFFKVILKILWILIKTIFIFILLCFVLGTLFPDIFTSSDDSIFILQVIIIAILFILPGCYLYKQIKKMASCVHKTNNRSSLFKNKNDIDFNGLGHDALDADKCDCFDIDNEPDSLSNDELDLLYDRAIEVFKKYYFLVFATTLERELNINWSDANKLLKKLEDDGVISSPDSEGHRTVLLPELKPYQDFITYDDDNYEVPFFASKRERVAIDLVLDAKYHTEKANKTRSLPEFIENYDILLRDCHKLIKFDGKVKSVSSDTSFFMEHLRLENDYQKNLRDCLDRAKDEIISEYKGIYKYDRDHIAQRIESFKQDVDNCITRINDENRAYAKTLYNYLCHECKIDMNIPNPSRNIKKNINSSCDLSDVDKMEGLEFEYWCADLLRGNGFKNVEVTRASGDQGVDIIAVKDGIKYAIQCKCYSSDLGNKPVQEVNLGKSMYKCHIAAVMTNQHFTQGAIEAAEATGVLLWDRAHLAEMISTKKAAEL